MWEEQSWVTRQYLSKGAQSFYKFEVSRNGHIMYNIWNNAESAKGRDWDWDRERI